MRKLLSQLNGKIEIGDRVLSVEDKRTTSYAEILREDWKKFDILDLSAQVAKNKAFRKNIFTECSVFENSIFGKVAGKGQIVEFLKQPKFAEFPEIKTKSFLFATDGSLKKITKNKFFGSFSVVDAFNNYFFDTIELTEKTSSTHIEILALRSLFKSLSQVKLKDCTIIILVDSLSAIKLALGTDVRKEHLEILREIDGFRKKLLEKNVKDFFIHVRSHRNVSVFLNGSRHVCWAVIDFRR